MAQPADLIAFYRALFGRDPDPQGLAYWQANAPKLMAEGGPTRLRQAMIEAAAPGDKMQNTRISSATFNPSTPADWQSYMAKAGLEQQGINNMPGVFSDYASLAGATPDQANATMGVTPEMMKATLARFKANYGGLGGLGGTSTTAPAQ